MTLDNADVNFHIRARPNDRELIDRAAEITGSNRSQFIMSAAVEKAKDILLDQSTIYMNAKDFGDFLKLLDAPRTEAELEGLRRLMSLRPPWE